jgi:hypothetical protein
VIESARRQFSCIAALFISCVAVVTIRARGGTTETMDIDLGGQVRARLGVPVVVCTSEVGEKRWGRHQFVAISEYPGGRILLRHHAAEDAVKAYGTPSPTYVSSDHGQTWQSFSPDGLPPSGMAYPMLDGHFLCMPMARPLDAKAEKLTLPAPVGSLFSYNHWSCYRVDQCPEQVQMYMKEYEAVRWEPGAKQWKPELVTYDTSGALVWSPGTSSTAALLSRTCFERPPLRTGNELVFADYRSNFIQDDGTIPIKWGVTCMVSTDNGRTWQRRSTIALDREGKDALTEPMLAENVNGELVCVMRRADQDQKPMCITYSKDRGRTWEKPVSMDKLGSFGVFPALVTLDCGVMVLCYGRPGIYLTFSVDGTGRNWSDPFCMLAGDPTAVLKHTDGYTCMLPIGANRLLLAYSDFDHKDANGQQRKAILVRTITIEGTAGKDSGGTSATAEN